MLTIDDESLLPAFEQAEASDPSPKKFVDDTRTIYGSRKLGLPKDSLWGQPVLCDFGEARIGLGPHRGLIQPELYRAPEVLFDMGWESSADIWNVAVMVRLNPRSALRAHPFAPHQNYHWNTSSSPNFPSCYAIRHKFPLTRLLLSRYLKDMGSLPRPSPFPRPRRGPGNLSNPPHCRDDGVYWIITST